MTEPKLLTEADFEKLWDVRRERKVLYAFLRERGLIAPGPVDALIKDAVELAALNFEAVGDDETAFALRSGRYNHEVDDIATIPGVVMCALKRGMELRPALTQEMVRAAYAKVFGEAVYSPQMDALHAALTEQVQP